MALAYLTLGERRFYTSSGTWPVRFLEKRAPSLEGWMKGVAYSSRLPSLA